MSLKNIQLINAEEVSNLFQTKYDTSSFIRVLSSEKQIDLATATSSTNAIVQGEQIGIKIGSNHTIELDEYQQDIRLELRDLGWGLLLFINEVVYYLRVNTEAQELEFESIINYPTLRIVDFGSGKNEAIKNLDCLVGLKQLHTLNLNNCPALVDLKGLVHLTKLEALFLDGFSIESEFHHLSCLKSLRVFSQNESNIKNVKHLKDLKQISELSLKSCNSLTSLDGISLMINLTFLGLSWCESLKSLDGISGKTNLKSLDLSWCESLISLEAISGLTNLRSLDLGYCKSLISLEAISELNNLTSLNLMYCISLTSLEAISGLNNLTSLDLSWFQSLTNLEVISGLINITDLNLYGCKSLTSLESISRLTNLRSLNLSWNEPLKSIESILSLTNLTSLDLKSCHHLTSLEGISELSNLNSLNMDSCKSIIFIKKITDLQQLSELDLSQCGNIRDFEELIHCPNLKEVTWIHEASCSYVLTGSAVRRGDRTFIKEKIEKWISDLQFSKNPIPFAKELIDALGLIKNENVAKEHYLTLAKVKRERGLADGETGNALTAHIWELWVEGVMNNESFFQEILSETLVDINYERELEVVVSPIISALADISVRYPFAKEWALSFVKEQLESLVENEDWARTIAPAAAVFYAGMNLSDEVLFWLNKGTHPHIPKWKDTILLALVNYFAAKSQFSEAREYLQQIILPDVHGCR
jgi:Leucine-rich repeat (LRR) protein